MRIRQRTSAAMYERMIPIIDSMHRLATFLRHLWRSARSLRYLAYLSAMALPLMLVQGTAAQAHPHVWAQVRIEVLFDAAGVPTSVRHIWTFDEMFSAFAVSGLSKDDLSREKLQPLARRYVDSLKEYHYFTRAERDGAAVELGVPTSFALQLRNEELILEFTLPIAKPVELRSAFTLMLYDPSYFVALTFAKSDPVRLINASPRCAFTAAVPDKSGAVDEAYFQSLDPKQDWAVKFANSVSITCP
jgi:ABC-type uncharacterized transport system substrate-binding protein